MSFEVDIIYYYIIIILVNLHTLFELAENLALEMRFGCLTSHTSMFTFQCLCPGSGCFPDSVTRKKENDKTAQE